MKRSDICSNVFWAKRQNAKSQIGRRSRQQFFFTGMHFKWSERSTQIDWERNVLLLESYSGTRLGYFWDLLAISFLTKRSPKSFLGCFMILHFSCERQLWLLFGSNCATFYSNIWSHCRVCKLLKLGKTKPAYCQNYKFLKAIMKYFSSVLPWVMYQDMFDLNAQISHANWFKLCLCSLFWLKACMLKVDLHSVGRKRVHRHQCDQIGLELTF